MAVADIALVQPDVSPRAAQPSAEKKHLLSPEFGFQLLRSGASALVAIIVAWMLLKGDVSSTRKDVESLTATIQRIETNMPNPEVLNLRLQGLEKEIARAESESAKRLAENRELLAYVIALRMAVEKRGIDTPEPPKIE